MTKCIILTPTYNDWSSLKRLISEIGKKSETLNYSLNILIVNDASSIKKDLKGLKKGKIQKIEIVNLKKNVGSQIAIAVGLNLINKKKEPMDILILDSDGEDNPEKINLLLKTLNSNKKKIVVASRSKRRENVILKVLNFLRLSVTFLITGKLIDFGNYSCFNKKLLRKIIKKRELNLSYSGTIQKYLQIKKVSIDKNLRYQGESKVSLSFLFLYSLKIISIFKYESLIRSIFFIITIFLVFTFIDIKINYFFIILLLFILNICLFIINSQARQGNLLDLIEKIKLIK